ncbi:ATP-binding protein [Amycolatopsis roodepoortensis]|uniref:ATP-binding protein n=1 Tax=Amycolatopsis roodepoortensis TaxID=700274 RepID=UPI00214AEC35|nr:ATP-binding protein [Amycolatopsis roodepoortensis]UUV27724.1 ATP-binding protein [Amycolatopsis roodepoortensis]
MTAVVILIGLQASGKSTFFRREFAGTHVHVSKDTFPNARRPQARQLRMLAEALEEGRSVVVDNTNPSPEEWAPLIEVARRYGARVAGYWFPPDLEGSQERNARRKGKTRVPDVGLYATLKRLRRPSAEDGFDELYTVGFDGEGGFVVERG